VGGYSIAGIVPQSSQMTGVQLDSLTKREPHTAGIYAAGLPTEFKFFRFGK